MASLKYSRLTINTFPHAKLSFFVLADGWPITLRRNSSPFERLLTRRGWWQMIVKDETTNIFMLKQHLMPDYAHPAHPRPQKHAHQQEGHCLPHDLCPSHLQPTQPFYQFPSRRMHMFSYHTTAQKEKKIYYISLESSHEPNSTVPRFDKSKKSIQT